MFVSRAIQLERRPFGHDLVALYNAAVAGGMTLNTPDAKEFIEWINEWHCHGVKIRYLFTAERTLPICETLFPLAGEGKLRTIHGSRK